MPDPRPRARDIEERLRALERRVPEDLPQQLADFEHWKIQANGSTEGGLPKRLRILEDAKTELTGSTKTFRAFSFVVGLAVALIAIYQYTRGLG